MKWNYYDPAFEICTEEMPFTICIQTVLKDECDPEALQYAVDKAIPRYPYFAVKVIREGEEMLTVPNDRPIAVYEGSKVYDLGSEEVNGHMLALSWKEKEIRFLVSHVLTDGGGFFPFIKTVLYYYICCRYGVQLDTAGVRLAEDPIPEDELGNPFPEAKMQGAEALYERQPKPFFRLRDGGYVTDRERTVYRFRVREDEVMRFNYDHDASPCALISALMARAVWDVHPDVTEDLVSAVSFNLRPGLRSRNSYRMLSSALLLSYPERTKKFEVARLCTCTRGMVTLQSQPENVLAYARKRKESMEKVALMPDLETKRKFVGRMALEDSVNNTFSVSYVGKVGLGDIEPYLDAMYNQTDGSTWQTVFLEISAVNGWFDIAFLQGFSCDVYYRAFLRQLDACGLNYIEEDAGSMETPGMVLPE